MRGRLGVEVFWLSDNRGFAGGMNAGLLRALATGAEYVWVLNNDAFPDPDCLPRLVAALDADPRLGAVTPALFGTDGADQHAGGRITRLPCKHELLRAADLAAPVIGWYWLSHCPVMAVEGELWEAVANGLAAGLARVLSKVALARVAGGSH